MSLLASPLVVSGSPTEAEQLQAQRTATLSSPEAVNLQAASETAYERLGSEQAEKADAEAFPAVLDEPAGGPPRLSEGQRITGFAGAYTAQVELGSQAGAEAGVIESVAPIAIDGASGNWMPVDLSLRDVGGVLEPANPLVNVRLSKHLSEGFQLPAIGLSVTPVNSQGGALGGSEGTVSGASAFFANSMTDSDIISKPTTFGFLIDTSLRSAKSPSELSLRVGLPAGASLTQAPDGSGAVLVVREGATIARMPAPFARDASGRMAPVSVSLAGNMITLTVNRAVGTYRYPIEVDPEFNTGSDTTVTERNWLPTHSGWFSFSGSSNEMSINYYGSWDTNEYGALNYQTHRHSKIYEVNTSTSFSPSACCNNEGKLYSQDELSVSDTVEIHGAGGAETSAVVVDAPTSEWPIKTRLCPKSECTAASGNEDNTVTLQSTITYGSNPAEGKYNGVGDELKAATVGISQPAEIHSTLGFNTTSPEVDKTVNVLYGQGAWMNTHQGAFEYTGHDTGVGIDGINFELDPYILYKPDPLTFETFSSKSFLNTSACAGVQCAEEQKETLTYKSILPDAYERQYELAHYLQEGENRVRISPHDAIAKTGAGEHGEGELILKVDNLAPTKLSLSGLPTKGEVLQLGESAGHVTASATDGEAKVGEAIHPSSGVKSIALYVDGKEVGTPHGSCPLGECTASGEWTLNGAELGTGTHTVTVVATDNANNTAQKEFVLEVYSASPLPMGPGSVNPQSGDFALENADVNLSGGMGNLAVTRHYDSRNLKEGIEGPLGPQWTISLGSLASLEVLSDGSVMVVGPSGLTHFAKNSNGGFEAPVGDKSLTLTRHTVTAKELLKGKQEEYLLTDPTKGTTTRFTLPSGAKSWMPTVSEGPIATDTMTDEYTTAEPEPGKKIVEPSLEVAPHPSATCAYKKLEKGCRALEFNYAPSTTATGEAESEWGDYKGNLTRVYAIAWNPTKGEKGEMATVTVAQYSYDKLGRLRAEWDPRISPALKTIYGYDSEGHVTAITAPGRESTAFIYGTIPTDTSPGRLLKVTHAPVSTPLWSGASVSSTAAAQITGTPMLGERLAVSNGSWSGEPVVYGYQWENCDSTGKTCSAIPGAVNANYTPTINDVGHALVVLVTATNGGGSVVAASVPTPPISSGEGLTVSYSSSFGSYGTGNGQLREPEGGLATDANGNVWVSDTENSRLEEFNAKGEFVRTAGSSGEGAGQFKTSYSVTVDPRGNVWATDEGNNRVEEFTGEGTFVKMFGWGVSNGENKFETCTSACRAGLQGSGNGEFYVPEGIAVDSNGNIFVADRGNHRVQEFNSEETYLRSMSQAVEKEGPFYLNLDASGDVWVAYSWDNKIGEFNSEGKLLRVWGTAGSGTGQLSDPYGVAIGPEGDVWVSEYGNNRVQVFSQTGEYLFGFGSKGNGPGQFNYSPHGLAFYGNNVYVLDSGIWWENTGNSRVETWLRGEEGQLQVPQPGTTIEYNVPVSGTGAPYQMSGKEAETWNEKEKPVQAAAIFPPDEPQSWPATKYTRASVDYMNAEARTVNNAAPGGGISTTEYGPYGEVEKTLSAANRQTALNEGGNTALNAARLSTKSAYEGEGTRLAWTEGPEHVVKIVKGNEKVPSGTETLAYNRVLYYYDEGAPANGETYDLVTKTVDEAETPTGEHFDIRTSTTSYSGQNNLGWKLRTPTSTVSDPEGLKITHTTVYDETTGNALETRGPASTGPGDVHDAISVYYTSEANATYLACGGHIEWTGLPCEVLPGKQPETPGLPPLPAKTVAYNMWDEPEAVTEAFGSTTRTRKTTFDEAGRALTSEVVSTVDAPVPTVSDHYDETTGALVKESETVEGKEKTITSAFNKLGQLTSYTDADGNATVFEYEGEGSYKGEKEINGDGRLRHINDGRGTQTYTYDETSGLLTKLADSAAGTFTASYDAFGRMTSETYPNNMTAYYTRNSVGATTSIEYKKNAHCATSCPEVWFNDTIMPSVHGEMLKQASSLSEEPKYVYDEAGRLTEVQEIPAGKGCVTRLYAYDVESNRTSLTSREPNSEGKCATTGGVVESHTYDQANRLIDTGVGYDTFGNTTKVPPSDSGGAGISSSFYVDSQLASQEQNEVSTSYTYDPSGRLLVTKSKGKTSATTTLPHYGGAGRAVTWTCEEAESSKECEENKATKWTRNIPGMDGALTATQTSGGTITLLLHDLQGNVVAEAALSETETKLLKTYNSTEFGVPQPGTTPPKYSWLGASGVASESSTGTIVKDGITYVPQTGRSLQTQSLTVPVPQNAAKEYTDTLEPWVAEQDAAAASQQVANAEQARRALEEANKPPGVLPSGNPGWWCGGEYGPCEGEEEEEEGGCSGTSACAASVNPHHHPGVIGYHERGNGYAGCSVWTSYGSEYYTSGISGEIEIVGHWKCKEFVPKFEMQIALLVFYEEKWVEIGAPYTHDYFWEKEDGGIENSHDFGCGPEHLTYDAWIFGRQYDGSYKARWWSWGREAEYRGSCHGGVALPEAP